ncbi:MAG: uracil phosphoribosyltransferase [Candidatus Gastranaerophilales bacterium]|nr:uracil phosphoribosyltransferase [Candidatus Gastranaerophilales bacterium]
MEVLAKVKVLDHPTVKHNLAIIRDKNTDCEKFKNALKRITYSLIYEATRNLPTVEKIVETPLMKTTCEVFDESAQLIIAPILRAGMIFCEVAQDLLPFANVHHIGMYRDEETLEPVWYYDKRKEIKEDKEKVFVIILDPMLATGNSAVDAVENFISKGVKEENIVFVNLISSPEGIKRLSSACPKVQIISAALDEKLNSKGYILPGLGDAGDRIYNTPD